MTVPLRRRVSEHELRRRFNEGRFWQRVQAGHLQARVLKGKPCRLATGPTGTLSQIVADHDGSQKIALVHQYLRPDGTLGDSGRPDPKELLDDGIVCYV